MTSDFQILNTKIEEIRKNLEDIKTKSRDLFLEGIKEFFLAYPTVEAISWHQFTPYFNDGDECVFRVCDIELKYPGSDGEFCHRWHIKDDICIREGADKLQDIFSDLDDTMKSIFGDHVQITIGANGDTKVETFDHE